MANRLTMAEIDRILTLHTTERSNREIADCNECRSHSPFDQ
jgi:hypothetical protein